MPSLKDIEHRISSVKSTRQITSTMHMIASTKVGKSSKRLNESLPYTSAITKMLSSLSVGEQIDHPLLEDHADNKTSLFVVIVSDKGMAGGFNAGVLRETQHLLNKNKKAKKQTKIIACGKKAKGYFNFRNIDLEMEFEGCSDNPQFDEAEKIGNFAIDNYISEDIDEVVIIYNKCKNSMEQVVVDRILLPCKQEDLIAFFDNEDKTEEQNSESEYSQEIVYEPSAKSVLDMLIPTYVRTVIFNALIDSAAGEQVARRVAMQAATDNADEMIETLTRLYNSVRQNAITTEINEIVGGANAQDEQE